MAQIKISVCPYHAYTISWKDTKIHWGKATLLAYSQILMILY